MEIYKYHRFYVSVMCNKIHFWMGYNIKLQQYSITNILSEIPKAFLAIKIKIAISQIIRYFLQVFFTFVLPLTYLELIYFSCYKVKR